MATTPLLRNKFGKLCFPGWGYTPVFRPRNACLSLFAVSRDSFIFRLSRRQDSSMPCFFAAALLPISSAAAMVFSFSFAVKDCHRDIFMMPKQGWPVVQTGCTRNCARLKDQQHLDKAHAKCVRSVASKTSTIYISFKEPRDTVIHCKVRKKYPTVMIRKDSNSSGLCT